MQQLPVDVTFWDQLLWTRGPMYVIFLLLVILLAAALAGLIYYAPQLIRSHLRCVNSFEQSWPKIADSLERHEQAHTTINNSLHHMAEAGKEATNCPDVKRHLDTAQAELRRAPKPAHT